MFSQRRSDDTADLIIAARAADEIGNTIRNRVGTEAPELIARVDAMRASLRTMLDHADRSLKASQRLRMTDDTQHRDHIREIATANRRMKTPKKQAS